MNEKRPSLPPPRTRPLSETHPQPVRRRESGETEQPAPEIRRRRRYSDPHSAAAPFPDPRMTDPRMEEEFSLKKLFRSLAGYLFMLALLGGLIYLYMRSMEREASTEETIGAGLRSVAMELWIKGEAAGVTVRDPLLGPTIDKIKKAGALPASIAVLPAEGAPSDQAVTHEIVYSTGSRALLTLRVYADPAAGIVDVVSFTTAPQFKADKAEGSGEAEESLADKLRKFGIDEKVLQEP